MWTAVVLICTALPAPSCVSGGGPAFATEAECQFNFANVGLPHIRRNLPKSKIMGARCILWGEIKTDVPA